MNREKLPSSFQTAKEVCVAEQAMKHSPAQIWGKITASSPAIFTTLLAIAVAAPLTGNQLFTGTLVNAALFLATAWLGLPAALLLGVLPSVISFATGLLPALILPMVPFIIFSNWLLVATFAKFSKRRMLAVVAASLLKFTFLWLAGAYLVPLWLGAPLSRQLLTMMSWPQLLTALSGGILALGVMKIYAGHKIG